MRGFYRLVLLCTGVMLYATTALADPVRFTFMPHVNFPAKPTLTVNALEAISGLSIVMEPSDPENGKAAETTTQRFSQPSMKAGTKAVFTIGEGKAGTTRWKVKIECQGAGGTNFSKETQFDTQITRKVVISYDPKNPSPHLDLEKRFVEVRISEPAERAEILVNDDGGGEMGKGSVTFKGEAAGTWLRIPWEGKAITVDAVVLRLAITIYSTSGGVGKIDLYPWQVSVPHQEVSFDTGSAEIAAGERGKLDESYTRLYAVLSRVENTLRTFAEKGIVTTIPPPITLYVAGHTDTVGDDSANLTLSKNRARAIATYFREKGYKLPVLYAGFGERQPRVKTEDNTAEVRNRRVDYTLALHVPPLLPTITWQKL